MARRWAALTALVVVMSTGGGALDDDDASARMDAMLEDAEDDAEAELEARTGWAKKMTHVRFAAHVCLVGSSHELQSSYFGARAQAGEHVSRRRRRHDQARRHGAAAASGALT